MKKFISLLLFIICLKSHSQNVLKISPGTGLKITEDAFVVSENTNLINDGNLQQLGGRGAFKFIGDADITVAGISAPIFTRLIISKPPNTKLFLQQHISVTGELKFSGGLLDLNNFNIDLGTTGLLSGEDEATHVVGDKGGYIQIIRNLKGPSSVNPGNLGVIFTSSQNLGRTIIRRSHQLQSNNAATNSAVLRSYDISSSNDIGFNTKLRFTYFDAELNKTDESQLVIWRSIDNRNWTNLGYNSRSMATNFVERITNSGIGNDYSKRFIYQIALNDQRGIAGKSGTNNSDNYQINGLRLWPNPVAEDLWIEIGSSVESKAIIKLVDEKGSLVSSQQRALNPGKNILKVDMKRISAGTYLILVNWAGGEMQKGMKVVKIE